ncbi:MAG: 50S ribosomal protein L19 [Candidatus Komeilibacteria bacterium]|nr:50S ribosomal protein L19 [Candidatus Komeilibacteria bacterium]
MEEVTAAKLPELKPGQVVRVHQKIREKNAKGEEKERIQIFEGRIIAIKHGREAGATLTVRKVTDGFGVEKIFPLHSPNVTKIEAIREAKVRRSKLYYLREYKTRLKEKILR